MYLLQESKDQETCEISHHLDSLAPEHIIVFFRFFVEGNVPCHYYQWSCKALAKKKRNQPRVIEVY